MIQLGLSAFYHDAAACIVKDGKVLAASEEERFTEIKHDSSFPINAINWCLEYTNLTLQDIDQVCWYEVPELKKDRVLKTFKKRWWKTRKIKKKFLTDFKENDPSKLLKEIGYKGEIIYIPHHLSHAAFSFLTSPYKKAVVLCIDGVGEWDTVTIWKGFKNSLEEIDSIEFPTSLGLLYSTITAYLGFKPNEGEYKVMGLAPYGNPEVYFNKLDKIFINSTTMDMKYFTWEYSDTVMFNKNLAHLLELLPRIPGEEVTQEHKDLAAALQKIYEREFLKLVKKAKKLTGFDNICLGGGCAYNGVANTRAYKYFKSAHIPYAPSDAGSAIGACLYLYYVEQNSQAIRKDNTSPYLGPDYADSEVEKLLKRSDLSYTELNEDTLIKRTAQLINQGNIVAWFQGRMEFGARALGNRSILATPRDAKMREKLNYVIKKREGFRPFAPSVIDIEQHKWFDVEENVPYMNQVVKVQGHKRPLPPVYLPAATHIDHSARIHTVTKKQNLRYYKLIQEIGRVTGFSVVLNTSFNLKDQTITLSPKQAINRYLLSDIDILVINNFIVTKNGRK